MRKLSSTSYRNERSLLAACPYATTLAVLAPRWSAPILSKLTAAGESLSFSEVRALLPGISKEMLATRLRDLVVAGVLHKDIVASDPPSIRYALTQRGRALSPVLGAMEVWGSAGA